MLMPDLLEKIPKIEKEIAPPIIQVNPTMVPRSSPDSIALKKCMEFLECHGDLPDLSSRPITMRAITSKNALSIDEIPEDGSQSNGTGRKSSLISSQCFSKKLPEDKPSQNKPNEPIPRSVVRRNTMWSSTSRVTVCSGISPEIKRRVSLVKRKSCASRNSKWGGKSKG